MRRLLGGKGDGTARWGTPADYLIVGLGNPGAEFDGSRHNAGADAVLLLARHHGAERLRPEKGTKSVSTELALAGRRVALAIPTTYMNESGEAVAPLVRRFGIEDETRLVVIHDELDLEPGRLKIKLGGGTAGNNGLRSIQAHLHTLGFTRIRIGIGKPSSRTRGAEHVLKRPGKAERALLGVAIAEAADAVELLVAEGTEAAMNRFNAEPGATA